MYIGAKIRKLSRSNIFFMEEGGGTKLGLRRRVEFRGQVKEKALEEPYKDSNRMCWEGQLGVVLSRREVWFMMGSLVLSTVLYLRQVCYRKPECRKDE